MLLSMIGRAGSWATWILLFGAACGRNPSFSRGHDAGVGGEPAADAGEGGALGTGERASVVINEVVTSNEGVIVDELGETDDFVELVNDGDVTVDLGDYSLSDSSSPPAALPRVALEPGDRVLLWADGQVEQGTRHLPFRLGSDGDLLRLWAGSSHTVEELKVVALEPNHSLARYPDADGAFEVCRYATPGRPNGEACTPPPPPSLPVSFTFDPFTLEAPYPQPAGPLVISEAALHPPQFVEIYNLSEGRVALDDYVLRLSATAPGTEFPGPDAGVELPLGAGAELGPGERTTVPVSEQDAADVEATGLFEGVLSLFARNAEDPIDRLDFVRWPADAILTRQPDGVGRHVFCTVATPGDPNQVCEPLARREVGDRLRHLRTPGDFSALAEGATELGMAPVKFVLDMAQGGAIHLLSSREWALHYTFVREVLDGDSHLDRCIAAERAAFDMGWYAFSQTEYYQARGRRYLLGTLVHHASADLHTVEFALGDRILGEDMRAAFLAVMAHVEDPSEWALRPQDETQAATVLAVNGTVPIVPPTAPFEGMTFQPLTLGVGYGVLRHLPAGELEQATLGPDIIVVTDDVPNDLPLTGGLVTETFQTPLAHVNVLSQNRGTPNMALVDASNDPRLADHFDELVRLEVSSEGFVVEPADPAEAQVFWESRRPSGPAITPRLDTTRRELVDLESGGLDLLPVVGAKAAQLAELFQVVRPISGMCASVAEFELPRTPFAIPVVHFVEHFSNSGTQELLEELRSDPSFAADPDERAEGLARVRSSIASHPVDPELLAEVEQAIVERFGSERVRLRSSSNAEDLAGFNGAGLYTSASAELDDPELTVEGALRTVWASLYNTRAYDERELARIDHSAVAMGVLVHPAFLAERANGVAISRNVLDPIRSDIYYFNAQIGEASVTNPAPGVTTDQFIYRWPPRFPRTIHQSRSSLADGDVLSESEADAIACALLTINDHFRPLLDPEAQDPWFAMEVEFKFLGPERQLLIKQTRPHAFSGFEVVGDCREI